MIVVAGGRGAGKSFKLAAWVLVGHPVQVWPYWSRVAVVGNRGLKTYFVEQFGVSEHLVYDAAEFGTAQRGKLMDAMRTQIEIGVDEPAAVLGQILRLPVGFLAVQADEVWATAGALANGSGRAEGYVDLLSGSFPERVEQPWGRKLVTRAEEDAVADAHLGRIDPAARVKRREVGE